MKSCLTMQLTALMSHFDFLFIGCSTAVCHKKSTFLTSFLLLLQLSLTCTHPRRSPWIYALFGRSLHCRLNCFCSATVCLQFPLSATPHSPFPSSKRKNSLKQTGGNCNFKCSKLISACQDLITQPGLLPLAFVQRRAGRTQHFRTITFVSFCVVV